MKTLTHQTMKTIKANASLIADLEAAIQKLQGQAAHQGLFMIGKDLYSINLQDLKKLKK